MARYKAEARLQSVGRGRTTALEYMLSDIKGEVYRLLTNYMYLSQENLSVYIDVMDNGQYSLAIKAVTERFIEAGKHV